MIGSLFAGVSGLNANSTAMTVIGDNIANVNTTAFKSNRASFANILSQSLEGSIGSDIGRGCAPYAFMAGIFICWLSRILCSNDTKHMAFCTCNVGGIDRIH